MSGLGQVFDADGADGMDAMVGEERAPFDPIGKIWTSPMGLELELEVPFPWSATTR